MINPYKVLAVIYMYLSNRKSLLVQEPKEKRRGSISFNSRFWQLCGSKYTFMLLYILARRHFEKGTGDSNFAVLGPKLKTLILAISEFPKSRKENPQKPTQLSSRSHPRHLVGKRTAQKTPS